MIFCVERRNKSFLIDCSVILGKNRLTVLKENVGVPPISNSLIHSRIDISVLFGAKVIKKRLSLHYFGTKFRIMPNKLNLISFKYKFQ